MLLARRISRAKWEPRDGLAPDEIPADAITSDLRTRDNALSVWTCDGSDDQLLEVVLALAAGFERVDKVDVVVFHLDDGAVHAESTPGRTPVADLASRHRDIRDLDLSRLGILARAIHRSIREERWTRIPRREVLHLLADAVRRGRVAPDMLQDRVRAEVQRTLARSPSRG